MSGFFYYVILGSIFLFILSLFVTISQGLLHVAFWVLILGMIGKIIEALT